MIGRLRGVLVEKQPPEILIEVSGVGYEVNMPMTSFYNLPDEGSEATVYAHFVVREDAQLLYGFINKTERALFRELLKANGVGPNLALLFYRVCQLSNLLLACTMKMQQA